MNKEEITKEDILNVTGSMFDTMFDYVDNSNKELKQLQQENKQLQQELNQKNKIIEEIKTLIENYKHLCKDKGLNMHLTISMIEDILTPKGSEE